ncbi:transposase zinc-binding domain-containing protein, partial [Salmonella enterica subsp. enterica serovar Typhimurium]|nr:transposase zinc-binding domain-containing protein [Salmonella enterica subsp. enterica serovar Typhimurium]
MADILRRYGPAYRQTHSLSAPQRRAWRAIAACRTAELGGVRERCEHCARERYRYRSCGNRHCPQCQTQAKEAWRTARCREVLPVPYAHWVFTLPHVLNALAAYHARWVFDTLFACASSTLLELAGSARWLDAEPTVTLVLHTWGQDLRTHLHV